MCSAIIILNDPLPPTLRPRGHLGRNTKWISILTFHVMPLLHVEDSEEIPHKTKYNVMNN